MPILRSRQDAVSDDSVKTPLLYALEYIREWRGTVREICVGKDPHRSTRGQHPGPHRRPLTSVAGEPNDENLWMRDDGTARVVIAPVVHDYHLPRNANTLECINQCPSRALDERGGIVRRNDDGESNGAEGSQLRSQGPVDHVWRAGSQGERRSGPAL